MKTTHLVLCSFLLLLSLEVLEVKALQFGRFVKTLAYFNQLNPLSGIMKNVRKNVKPSEVLKPNSVVWSSDSNIRGLEWAPLDDVVMGGASESTINVGAQFAGEWKGFVTTENNGGFAGIRTKLISPPLDCSQCRGVILKVKGDGQRYKFIARDDEDWNGVAWSLSFDTKSDKWIEVKVPFTQLKPTKFARTVILPSGFSSQSLSAIQLTLSKFEYDGGLNPSFNEGYFSLVVESIKTY